MEKERGETNDDQESYEENGRNLQVQKLMLRHDIIDRRKTNEPGNDPPGSSHVSRLSRP